MKALLWTLDIAATLVLIAIVAGLTMPRGCGPRPWQETRLRITKLEFVLDACRIDAASMPERIRCAIESTRQLTLVDQQGTPLVVSATGACSTVPFCGIHSAGPNRVDECGSGDDLGC